MSFPGLALAGGVLDAGSQFSAGGEARNIAESEANMFDNQANLTKISAKQSEKSKRKSLKRLMSTQHAGYAAAGVALTGSALDVLMETAEEAELDIAIDNFNATNEQIALRNQAEATRKSGRASERTSRFKAASTLISAGAKFGAKQGLFNTKSGTTKVGQSAFSGATQGGGFVKRG